MFTRQILLAGVLVTLVGCRPGSPTNTEHPLPAEVRTDAALAIPLTIRSWEEVQTWIAEQRGKVVVIDLWSTYCAPCKREFPHFVAFHDTHREMVACASLSLDYYGGDSNPEDAKPAVREFLTSHKAVMQNFISSTPDSDVLAHVDSTSVPVALVYDQEGKSAHGSSTTTTMKNMVLMALAMRATSSRWWTELLQIAVPTPAPWQKKASRNSIAAARRMGVRLRASSLLEDFRQVAENCVDLHVLACFVRVVSFHFTTCSQE